MANAFQTDPETETREDEGDLADLPRSDQLMAARYFRRAIRARREQWDNERKIEALLNRELELEISEWAAITDGVATDQDHAYLADLYMQLGGIIPDWVAEAARRERR